MPIVTVVKDACSTIGEGPHWDETTECLYYVDIEAKSVLRWNSVTGENQKITLDKTIGFVVPWKKGGVIIGLGQTISHLDWDTEKITILHEVDQGKYTRFNDGKCDPRGRIWAGTMGLEKQAAVVEPEQGSLYCLYTDGSIKKQVENVTISNGLAWSSDNKTMYYIDSIPRCVYAFDYDIETGNINNQRIAVQLEKGTEKTIGYPDGMTIDTEGKLWVACFFGGRIIRFDPETGLQIGAVEMPGLRITSCCFGGKNYDEVFVTCSRHGSSLDELMKFPLSGSVFKVTGLGVQGCPSHMYEGEKL